ncbi:MAG TPA: hypothetical protein VGQ52_01740 [Gemmatimonadaceae bacterium]|jgi:hypothetical protein|nr:hypothetical protein [Gemmatimonadaceae bacterium]
MKIAVVVGVAVAICAVLFLLRTRVAEHGTYSEVPRHLSALKQSTDPTAFFGFHTRSTDALYFVYEGGSFNLDYELLGVDKEQYAEPFRKVAAQLGYKVLSTTYGQYPVLRVKLSAAESQAAEQGFQFAHRIFGIQRNTELEFLP